MRESLVTMVVCRPIFAPLLLQVMECFGPQVGGWTISGAVGRVGEKAKSSVHYHWGRRCSADSTFTKFPSTRLPQSTIVVLEKT